MKSDLFFDFSINKENNTIVIKREFDANLEQVWQAWTKTEFLDRWWAPKPYRVETKTLNFTEGGVWLYAMVSPENEKLWCKADYQKIEFKSLLCGWMLSVTKTEMKILRSHVLTGVLVFLPTIILQLCI